MVCSSHKLYGPKGAGALIASRHTQKALFPPILGGGGQEFGLRGGTSNAPQLLPALAWQQSSPPNVCLRL